MINYIIYFIIFIFIIFLFINSVIFRLIVLNPISVGKYGVTDLYKYFKYHDWNRCQMSDLICFTGLFGQGKTLSAVHKIYRDYKKYNNKKIYDPFRKSFVTQKVKVLTNVHLPNLNYEYMKSLSQIVSFAEKQNDIDLKSDTRTVLFVLIDEASVQLNSRNFKSNIDATFLNTLLCSRHYNICQIVLTSQRFLLCDKLLRDVTQKVIDCRKFWRFQVQTVYNAWELENCANPLLVQPILRTGFFVRRKDYENYDTHAVVENLMKSCANGDMLSDQEILNLRCQNLLDNDNITSPSRKLRLIRKKKN